MTTKIKATITHTGNVDRTLSQMPVRLREKSLKKALRKGGNEMAKTTRKRAPKPGYPGDKPGLMPLNKTIRTVIRQYGGVVVAVVGPKWPEGNHGHLVEFGHNIVRTTPGPTRTRPIPFMRQSADESVSRQQQAIIKSMRSDVSTLVR